MARVTWTDAAFDAPEEAWRYVARDSGAAAAQLRERIFLSTARLATFPRSGRVVPEVGDEDVREVIVSGYRVIYRVTADEVEVVTVRHGARQLGDLDV